MTETLITLNRPEAGIAVITLARPQAANALTVPMVQHLRTLLQEVAHDAGIRVVVVRAEGKVFCAGLDLKAVIMGDDAPSGAIENMALQQTFSGLMKDVARLPQPVVAAVNGAAVGAGMGLALAADVRVGTPATQFLIGAVKIGLSAGECGISYYLPRLAGFGRANEIMLTGRAIKADEALDLGLMSRSGDDAGALAMDVAREIAENSPYSIKHTKQVMRANADAPSLEAAIELEDHVQCLALMTEDFEEACRAFADKRKPVFKGR